MQHGLIDKQQKTWRTTKFEFSTCLFTECTITDVLFQYAMNKGASEHRSNMFITYEYIYIYRVLNITRNPTAPTTTYTSTQKQQFQKLNYQLNFFFFLKNRKSLPHQQYVLPKNHSHYALRCATRHF